MPPAMRLDGLDEAKRPNACIGCGQCMHACPQGIDVPSALSELVVLYENGPKWSREVAVRSKLIMVDLK